MLPLMPAVVPQLAVMLESRSVPVPSLALALASLSVPVPSLALALAIETGRRRNHPDDPGGIVLITILGENQEGQRTLGAFLQRCIKNV